jgi:hypothetical protein
MNIQCAIQLKSGAKSGHAGRPNGFDDNIPPRCPRRVERAEQNAPRGRRSAPSPPLRLCPTHLITRLSAAAARTTQITNQIANRDSFGTYRTGMDFYHRRFLGTALICPLLVSFPATRDPNRDTMPRCQCVNASDLRKSDPVIGPAADCSAEHSRQPI